MVGDFWRRSEAAVTRRTRNAFIGSSRYEGSNPSVSALKPLIFQGFFFLRCISCCIKSIRASYQPSGLLALRALIARINHDFPDDEIIPSERF